MGEYRGGPGGRETGELELVLPAAVLQRTQRELNPGSRGPAGSLRSRRTGPSVPGRTRAQGAATKDGAGEAQPLSPGGHAKGEAHGVPWCAGPPGSAELWGLGADAGQSSVRTSVLSDGH